MHLLPLATLIPFLLALATALPAPNQGSPVTAHPSDETFLASISPEIASEWMSNVEEGKKGGSLQGRDEVSNE